ncbi:MAG: type I 3-dehydroquinate dehydratase [Planctomycetes bacterium]|nr:type I 3-dehydroquinate dehydratase [Planctomycetota bacterium]
MACRIVASVRPAGCEELLAAAVRARADGADLLELRADAAGAEFDRWLECVPRLPLPTIVTVRPRTHGGEFSGPEAERLRSLARATRVAAWIDVEAETAAENAAFPGRARRIVSHHDWNGTPDDLEPRLAALVARHPDAVVKLAATARSLEDVTRIVRAQRRAATAGASVACFALGEIGSPTRHLAGCLGATLVYGAIAGHEPTAPGQVDVATLAQVDRVGLQTTEWSAAAVIGDPIGHSLSPRLHGRLYAIDRLPRALVPIRAADLAAALRLCDALGITGAAITLPHKEAATALAVGPIPGSPWPPSGGATNTLIRAADGWRAANSDVIGLAAAIDAAPAAALARVRHALLLGAGGAARSALFVLRQRGIAVTVTARRAAAAAALAGEFGAATAPWAARADVGHDLLINATPVGMAPRVDDSPFPAAALRRATLVLDLVYRPRRTRLLQDAAAAGALPLEGVTMFVAQALAQHACFTGRAASPAAAAAARAEIEAALAVTAPPLR